MKTFHKIMNALFIVGTVLFFVLISPIAVMGLVFCAFLMVICSPFWLYDHYNANPREGIGLFLFGKQKPRPPQQFFGPDDWDPNDGPDQDVLWNQREQERYSREMKEYNA